MTTPEFEYWVDVGFTTQRSVIPDQYVSRVQVLATSDSEAHLVALHMVGGRPDVVMTTSSQIDRLIL